MKRIKLILITGPLFLLLNSSAWVNLTLVRPSELMVPAHIRNIAIIERTKQEATTKNKVEQVMTGEVFKQDEQAVIQTIEGFINACSGVDRFQTIRTTEKYTSDGSKSTFPTALDWNTITDICNKYETDALLSIEIFDTDFILTNSPIRLEVKDINGKMAIRPGISASGVAVINFGIRLYDAANRVIVDEYQTTHRMNFDGQGTTLQDALNQILDKVAAVNRASFDVGYIYGQRITPTYYKATRYFFNKPKKALGAGVRYSEVADWQNAIKAWTKVVDNGKQKHAGRAAYNIAVGYEVLGDLEKAKEWAARSHTEFEEKEADDYYKILSNRIREENIVNTQIPE